MIDHVILSAGRDRYRSGAWSNVLVDDMAVERDSGRLAAVEVEVLRCLRSQDASLQSMPMGGTATNGREH
jgi:hypothetical protein